MKEQSGCFEIMMSCDQTQHLHAYHDGELSTDERAAIESHLSTCAECAAELAQLRRTSALFAAAPRERLSQIARHRLSSRIDAAMERGLVRLAWSLSGAAAAVLLVGSAWLAFEKQPVQSAPPWVQAVVYANPITVAEETPAAQWYLADASNRSDDTP